MQAGGDQGREVGDVGQKVGADLLRQPAEPGEVDSAGISRAAGDDHARPMFACQRLKLLFVQQSVLPAHAVLDDAEPLAQQASRRADAQVAASGAGHAENGVTRLQQPQAGDLSRLIPAR